MKKSSLSKAESWEDHHETCFACVATAAKANWGCDRLCSYFLGKIANENHKCTDLNCIEYFCAAVADISTSSHLKRFIFLASSKIWSRNPCSSFNNLESLSGA